MFPLVPDSKVPLTQHGFLDATKDIQQINKWWNETPNANIGIATGKESGFFVLDVDTRHNGHETLEELLNYHRIFPDTVQAITGGGGTHYLFKYHEGIGSRNNLQQGLDIKGDGGYIVVAPSIHPDTEKAYQWELSSRPIENEISEAPDWLLDMIIKPEKEFTKKPSSYWMEVFNNTREGNRNNNAASLAGHLLRKWVDPLLVGEIMHLWNAEKVSPPLENRELETVINSVANKEIARRKGG